MVALNNCACILFITVLAARQCSGSSAIEDLIHSLGYTKSAPKAPKYARSYEVAYNFTLPFESEVQPDGLTFPVHVWRDNSLRKIRQDTYGGVNSLIATEEANLEIFPKIDKLACAKYEMDPGEKGLLDIPVIPDVSSWEYTGTQKVNGLTTYVWEYAKTHGDKHTRYEFYSSEDGNPVRLYMHGNDLFSGAHFDVYIADYYSYIPGHPDPRVFDLPGICNDKMVEERTGRSSYALQMIALLPAVSTDAPLLDLGSLGMRGKAAPSGLQANTLAKDSSAFSANLDLVQKHNAKPNRTYSLEVNRFAYWTQEEFEGIMLPRHRQKRGLVSRSPSTAELPYERKVPKGRIPGAVDWKGSAADQHVLDQAACGSCWAFGAAGALQGAHFLATGKKGYFSEQQMMDCSWGYGLNQACDGGDYDAAMDYLKKAGGMAGGKQYEYLGADGYCRASNFTSEELTPFEGYAFVPKHDDEALMEAVYSRGPIAVSLDASQPSFRFYSGGVMDEPNCMWKSEDLDHAVLLVGYGTCPETGLDYWLIRNSWSTHWGDKGYVKISRRHGCGITTDPLYAVFTPTEDAAAQKSS